MSHIKFYRIIVGSGQLLQEEVNSLIAIGWIPWGGVSRDNNIYCQAMVKHEEEIDLEAAAKSFAGASTTAGQISKSEVGVSSPPGKQAVSGNDAPEQAAKASNGNTPQPGQDRSTSTGSTVLDSCKSGGSSLDRPSPKGGESTGIDLLNRAMEQCDFMRRIETRCKCVEVALEDHKELELLQVFQKVMEAHLGGFRVTQERLIKSCACFYTLDRDRDGKLREARRMINTLRHEYGMPVLSGGDGYWIPKTQAEAQKWLHGYALEVLARNETAWGTVMVLANVTSCDIEQQSQMHLGQINRHKNQFDQL